MSCFTMYVDVLFSPCSLNFMISGFYPLKQKISWSHISRANSEIDCEQVALQSKRREGEPERLLFYRGESTESGVNTVSSQFCVCHSMLALLVSLMWDIVVLSASKLLNLTHRFSCMLDLVAIVPRINWGCYLHVLLESYVYCKFLGKFLFVIERNKWG